MEFAIVMNTTSDERGRAVVNYKEVKRMFDFICRNVKLPDLPRDSMDALSDGYVSLMQSLVKECAAKKEDK